MRYRIYLLLIGSIIGNLTPVAACVNTYGINILGESTYFEESDFLADNAKHYSTHLDSTQLRKKQKLLEQRIQQYRLRGKLKTDSAIQDLSDYAALLIVLGQPRQAANNLRTIEQSHPGLYNTAINLGTAYELLGINDSAWYWIKRGVAINPKSHKGSEWIHVKILEAKIELERDPAWLTNHSILGISFGSQAFPILPKKIKQKPYSLLKSHLEYQLRERMFFVHPQDTIVGELLFMLADLYALDIGVESALPLYNRALDYGTVNPSIVQGRRNRAGWVRLKDLTATWWPAFIPIAFISMIILFVKKYKQKRSIGKNLPVT